VSLTAVYDEDGNTLTPGPGNDYIDNLDGTITMVAGFAALPDKVDFVATPADLGTIITTEIANHAAITYAAANWDTTETGNYIANTYVPYPAIYFDGDELKDLIQDCLKNDMIYLITLPDGRLTLRHYWNDKIYPSSKFNNHVLEPWIITQWPEKRFTDSKYWLSRARVEGTDTNIVNAVYDITAQGIYQQEKQRSFESKLYVITPTLDELANFAQYLAERFYLRRERIKLPIGKNTIKYGASGLPMKLLDTVSITMNINGRFFTRKTEFKIVGIDYAQDILTLEEI